MSLINETQHARLLAQGSERVRDPAFDPLPVLKVYTPDARAVWLLAWVYPDDPGRAHTLCDAGTGFPGLIDIRIEELETIRGPRGVRLAVDTSFVPTRPLSAYAARAIANGAYVED